MRGSFVGDEVVVRELGAEESLESYTSSLCARYGDLEGEALLEVMIEGAFAGSIMATSSFGAESAVLLDMVANVDKDLPVIFLDTGKLFEETYNYVHVVQAHLGLRNVQLCMPSEERLSAEDKAGDLWQRDADRCCHIRKVEPLRRVFEEHAYKAWITGRKRFHGDLRLRLQTIEYVGGMVKINPLAHWSLERIHKRFEERGLPLHPLVGKGYPSIGCYHCTHRAEAIDNPRAGRWADKAKTECGIHHASWMQARKEEL
ncbi:MAG: phosphoadenylyl-sulfate reductase [Alphaproteobacteria bacterium GM7ARS4]|nr:phosphoadenylyl-sulfate reductase [Alphaproteobacteria bacterium GM7ARS4]